MQAIFETAFDIVYLVSVMTLGIIIVKDSRGNRQFSLFGIMAIVLGAGDAFHLVPRAVALCTTGLESYTAALGFGKLVTSITMTVFYVILYHVWMLRYGKKERLLTSSVYALAAIRIILCLMPQNDWLSAASPLSWGIYRNIPFTILGIMMIVLFHREAKANSDTTFRWMWLAITLSFACYIPVVLFSDSVPVTGMLMIPKTCAYVWAVVIGYKAMRKECR